MTMVSFQREVRNHSPLRGFFDLLGHETRCARTRRCIRCKVVLLVQSYLHLSINTAPLPSYPSYLKTLACQILILAYKLPGLGQTLPLSQNEGVKYPTMVL